MNLEMNKPKRGRKVIKKVLILIFSLILVAGCVYLGVSMTEKNESKKAQGVIEEVVIDEKEVTIEKTDYMLKLEKLQEINKDIVAYIEIEGTNISYPVLQTDNNDYYMTKTYDKKTNKNGSIFLDKAYNWKKPSSNLLIYGHNYYDKQMFSGLLKYEKESYYKEHSKIRFVTNKEDAEYEIIAVFKSRMYKKAETNVFRYYFFVDAENEAEYNEFVNNALKASLYKTEKTAKYGDQLLTLSTCSTYVKNGRFAVVARKIEK